MPEIKFPCPACKVTLKVSDTLAGKKIKCPKCTAIAPVPAASAAPTASASPPAAPPKPAAAPRPTAPPPAPAKAAAPAKPAVPLAKPVAPQARKPAPPPPPPIEEPPADEDLAGIMPASDVSGFTDEGAEDEEERPALSARRREPPAPKQGGKFVPMLVSLLLIAYGAGLALVYLGYLLPMPEPLKVP